MYQLYEFDVDLLGQPHDPARRQTQNPGKPVALKTVTLV